MTSENPHSDSSVSRRETIRFGLVGGLSAIGLAAPAAADQAANETDRPPQDPEQEPEGQTQPQNANEEPTGDTEQADAEDEQSEADEQQSEADEQQSEDGGSAQISFSDQESSGGSVTVDSVSMSDGGFISIHDERRFEGQVLGSIIGITGFLEPGQHSNVSVPFFTANATASGPGPGQDANGLTETQQLIAIPHRDGNGSGQFDGEPDPAYENGPSTLGQFGAVNDVATVTVTGGGDEEPSADEPQQPAEDAQQPTDDPQQSADDAQQPTDDPQQSADDAQQPTDDPQQSADDAQQSPDDPQQSADDAQQSPDDAQQPADGPQ